MSGDEKRLPSFSDFSPEILQHDIRRPLEIVARCAGDRPSAVAEFAIAFFRGKKNNRSSSNIPSTLTSTGLVDGATFTLTPFGTKVLGTPDPLSAARAFVAEIILNHNGLALIDAIRTLYKRRETGSRKALLKRELRAIGITGLSNATTDHTTLENWFVEAGIVVQDGPYRKPDDAALTALVGVSADEFAEFLSLEPSQRLFLEYVYRRQLAAGAGQQLALGPIYSECLRNASAFFDEDNLRGTVVGPLESGGWIIASPARSGKGGWAQASAKTLRVPIEKMFPWYSIGVPGDLRDKLTLPLADIKQLLGQPLEKKYERGLGLELLALRMLIDLGLEPRGFRVRAREVTAAAEVDLQAEGRNLLFSRWVVQCKNMGAKVTVSDVAKEVGIATYQKAHVVTVITTSEFTSDAHTFASEVMRATHLQFLLVPGDVVREYLTNGPGVLLEYVMENARDVMRLKTNQVPALGPDVATGAVAPTPSTAPATAMAASPAPPVATAPAPPTPVPPATKRRSRRGGH